MKALISPTQASHLGQRIAQVSNDPFDVAKPLFWVDCPLECIPEDWYYDGEKCVMAPLPPPEADPAQPE